MTFRKLISGPATYCAVPHISIRAWAWLWPLGVSKIPGGQGKETAPSRPASPALNGVPRSVTEWTRATSAASIAAGTSERYSPKIASIDRQAGNKGLVRVPSALAPLFETDLW